MLKLAFVLSLVAAWPAQAERNTLCDDGGPVDVTCSVSLPSLGDFMCGSNGVVALQSGCYLCVDATTCTGLGSLELNAEEQGKSLPRASGNDISGLLQDQADSPEDSALDQAAVDTHIAGNSLRAESIAGNVKPPEVSSWLFSIPVCLAVISLGLAVRARVPSRLGFQRLQDSHDQSGPLCQDNINPFCDSEEDEDVQVEEAQFLPSTELEDEVLLHIKEAEQEDDEEEVEI